MIFPPLTDAMRTALLDNLGPGAYANAGHLDKAYAAMVLAAGGEIRSDAGAPRPAEEVARIVAARTDRARRIYIAGAMTGLPGYNFSAFNAKAAELRADGWHVENPAEHGLVAGANWDDYMRWDLARVATCGAIYLLPGWADSKGATLEECIGKFLDMSFQGAVSNMQGVESIC